MWYLYLYEGLCRWHLHDTFTCIAEALAECDRLRRAPQRMDLLPCPRREEDSQS